MSSQDDASTAQATADESPVEYWLRTVPLIAAAISGVLGLLPQTYVLFERFDYVAEVLLLICTAGIMLYGWSLLKTPSLGDENSQPVRATHRIGMGLVLIAPMLALAFWYAALRLPAEQQAQVEKLIARGNTELYILEDPEAALTYYRHAQALAPRRASIRKLIKLAEETRSKPPIETPR